MKLITVTPDRFFIILLIIISYHYYIQNRLEKMLSKTYFDIEMVKRPLANNNYNNTLNNIGMPSGHAELVTIISCILYFYDFIPLWICILMICIISYQRVITKRHTINQVIAGIICGLIYSYIYISNNLSVGSLGMVLCIGFILILLIVYKINKQIYEPIYI